MESVKKFKIKRCNFHYRFMAGFIDGSIWLIIWYQTHHLLIKFSDYPPDVLQLPDKLILLIIFIYFVLMEGTIGATIGKLVFGIQVRKKNFKRISILNSFIRNLSKLLSILPMFLGYILIILRQDKRALHDRISDSIVVRLEKK